MDWFPCAGAGVLVVALALGGAGGLEGPEVRAVPWRGVWRMGLCSAFVKERQEQLQVVHFQ